MQKYILIRLGLGPDPRVSQVLSTIIDNREPAVVAPLPGVVMSFFSSTQTHAQIKAALDAIPNIGFVLSVHDQSHTYCNFLQPYAVDQITDIQTLQHILQVAIEEQDFEKATQLRNQINSQTQR